MVEEAEVGAEVVDGSTTSPKATGEEVATVEPAVSTVVVIPPVVVETKAKMMEDSTAPMIELTIEDINVQTKELTRRSSVMVDQAVTEGSH